MAEAAEEKLMWRYLLLGISLLGLGLFFILSFEHALIDYLGSVLLAYFIYYKFIERAGPSQF